MLPFVKVKGTTVKIFWVFAAVLPVFGRILRPPCSGGFVRGCRLCAVMAVMVKKDWGVIRPVSYNHVDAEQDDAIRRRKECRTPYMPPVAS